LLKVFRDADGVFQSASLQELPEQIIWIDLVSPTDEEKKMVETRTGVRIASFETLSEIENSSRLAVDHGVIYLSTPVAQGDARDATLSPVGFVLTQNFVVTIRFTETPAFSQVRDLIERDESIAGRTCWNISAPSWTRPRD
jgi:magnesium transporter